MPTLPKSDPALHLLIPPFLVYLAQYPSDYSVPSTLFAPSAGINSDTAIAKPGKSAGSGVSSSSSTSVDFLSVTRSEGEITILYSVPDDTKQELGSSNGDNEDELALASEKKRKAALEHLGLDEPKEGDGPYAAIRVQGPLDLSLTGILAALADTLRTAKVPIFAISTWNTDYILVRQQLLTRAQEALIADGWHFVSA